MAEIFSNIKQKARTGWEIGKEVPGRTAAFGQSIWGSLGATKYGRAFREGFGEAFGWQYKGGKSIGLGGWRDTNFGRSYTYSRTNLKEGIRKSFIRGRKAASKAAEQTAKRGLARGALGFAGRLAIPAFTAWFLYQGYQEGGVLGAAKAGLMEGAMWGGFKMAGVALGSAGLWTTGALAAGAYGYYAAGEAAQKHEKRLRHLEMGGQVVDPFGTAATMRQRSLSALQNTHVNGRMAMGNEAVLMHSGAVRRPF